MKVWHERKERPKWGKEILLHSVPVDGKTHFWIRSFIDEEDYANYNIRGMWGKYEIMDWAYCEDLLFCIELYRATK